MKKNVEMNENICIIRNMQTDTQSTNLTRAGRRLSVSLSRPRDLSAGLARDHYRRRQKMRKLLDRSEAVKIAGGAAVIAAEKENCEPTCRVGYNGDCQGDDLTEWCAVGDNRDNLRVSVYYYTSNDQNNKMAECDGDGSVINWVIAGYDIT